MIIEDGANGTRFPAGVNSRNQLQVTTEPISEQASAEGSLFNLNTQTQTITVATQTGVAFMKNNETNDFFIRSIVYIFGTSTGGPGNDMDVTLLRNPDSLSSPSNATISNLNYGSNKTLDATWQYSASGALTGGDFSIGTIMKDAATNFINLDIRLSPGSSLGVNLTPGSGNTSLDFQIALIGFLEDF